MRLKSIKTTGILLLAGFIMPCGVLLANKISPLSSATSGAANWYNVEQASNLFGQMNTLALGVTRDVARLQAQGYELGWRVHSQRLGWAKSDINSMGGDLMRLNKMKSRLEPWQQSLLQKVTPYVHEMVYQTDEALHTLDHHEDRRTLSLTQYPQNIDVIYQNADQMADTIDTVTHYVQAEQKMAAMSHPNGTEAGS